jgi:hypothetical protein
MGSVKIKDKIYDVQIVKKGDITIPEVYLRASESYRNSKDKGETPGADIDLYSKVIKMTKEELQTKKEKYENFVHEILHGILYENKSDVKKYISFNFLEEEEFVEILTTQMVEAFLTLKVDENELVMPDLY